MRRFICVAVLVVGFVASSNAQNLLVNGSFEKGSDSPDGWKLSGTGEWNDGQISVTGPVLFVCTGAKKGQNGQREITHTRLWITALKF